MNYYFGKCAAEDYLNFMSDNVFRFIQSNEVANPEGLLRNFQKYAKENSLSQEEIVRGKNEISLEVNIHNLIKSKGNLN